ncbi:MAG: hypothetical protein JRH01_17040 [Deltaproteobacteria bacterium]|nr:hypothetical protein [Deltaproteobacteria bacterium]MBW2397149.1 hypothetical protein [Deltaproteobacteria bacterium]
MASCTIRSAAIALFAILVAFPAASDPTLETVLAHSPFSSAERSALLSGRTIIQPLSEAGDRELAVGAACLIPGGSVSAILEPFLGDRPILPEEHVVKTAVLRGEPSAELFRGIELEPNAAAEIARYLKARPGLDLNLSSEEIAEFTAIERSRRTNENISKVHMHLRQLLASRYASYRESGLEGVAAYARSRGSHASPGEELRRSTRAAGLRHLAPTFERAWLNYPREVPAQASETYFWARVDVNGRPAVALVHRLSLLEGTTQVVGQRNFYVSHFFDSGESLLAVGPVEKGILVLYQDRIWLDDLSGLSGRLKRTLGRRFLESHVEQTIRALGVCRR